MEKVSSQKKGILTASADIISKDDLLSGKWTPIRNSIWSSSELSQGAKLCYIAIIAHLFRSSDTVAWPGQKRLGELLGVSERSIRNYLSELENIGIIFAERRGLNQTNRYYVCKPDKKLLKPTWSADRKQASAQERNAVADEEDVVKEKEDIDYTSYNRFATSGVVFLDKWNKYNEMHEDENIDKRELTGCVKDLLDELGIKNNSFAIAQKARKIGDEKLSKLLWRMYGMKMSGDFDDDDNALSKYLFACINPGQPKSTTQNTKNTSNQPQATMWMTSDESKAELISKYKLFWDKAQKGEKVKMTQARKQSLEADARKREVSLESLQRYMVQIFKEIDDE
jgi:hypothetical protein